MKKIIVVYRNRENYQAIRQLNQAVEYVFGEYAVVEPCYINELEDGMKIEADVFVVIDKQLLVTLKKYTVTFKNIVIMTRSVRKECLEAILRIPAETDVLVVNDTYQSAEEMVFMFYELGIGHLNFIPFGDDREASESCAHVHYAITPNEPDLVPKEIEQVINTGYRKIGFDTMVQIMNALELNNARVNGRLLSYIATIIEPMQDFRLSYYNSFLKGQMLNEYVYDSKSAIFLVDQEGRLVYYNKKAEELFLFHTDSTVRIRSYLNEELMELIEGGQETNKQIVSIEGRHYIVDKISLALEEQELGYFVILQDEIVIKDMERSLNKKLIDKGLFAKYTFHDIKRNAEIMKETVELAKKAAATEYTILIRGESGTGKELFAQSMHNYSSRKNFPFVGVNCAAIPESLLESELFGYEEGAFTGASKKGKLGYFEQASKGTIFLDEIGDISPKLQARLLRVLQEKQIMRIGSDKVIDVDIRIIAATNKDLLEEVKKGNFRDDLYYRLNAIQICVPPLRQRREDILLLFKEFMGEDFIGVRQRDWDVLKTYDWPGNVRELANCALYYKTLGRLPEQFQSEPVCVEHNDDAAIKKRIQEAVLRSLAESNALGHGPGKAALHKALKDRNIAVSDAKLREILAELQEEGLLVIGRGRQGTKITEKGIAELA